MDHFWDIRLANIITWIVFSGGFIGTQYVTMRLLGQRMDNFEEWRRVHDNDAKKRDTMIVEMKISTERLTVLAEVAERRLARLEH